MELVAVRKRAEELGISSVSMQKMSKPDVIRAIQRAEGNAECFGSTAQDCQYEGSCCWVADCYPEARRRAKATAPTGRKLR